MNLIYNNTSEFIQYNFANAKASIAELMSDYRTARKLSRKSRFGKVQEIDFPVASEYFVASDRGVFLLKGNKILKVFDLWTTGIAISPPYIYLACSVGLSSFVLEGNLDAFLRERADYCFKELYRCRMMNTGHRIHQVCLDGNALWLANTGRNTLTKLDRKTGEVIVEIAPFLDQFGAPILYDNNHINSVSICGNTVLFVAYKAGNQALIGVYGDNLVRGYFYRNTGVHDIFLSGHHVYFSDTFGEGEQNQGGRLMVNAQPFDPRFFDTPPGFIVRGLAGMNGQLVIGHSHKGERKHRFKGNGSLLLAQENHVTHCVTMPFAQCNDIIHTSGESFKTPPAPSNFAEVCKLLESVLGSPGYEVEVQTLT